MAALSPGLGGALAPLGLTSAAGTVILPMQYADTLEGIGSLDTLLWAWSAPATEALGVSAHPLVVHAHSAALSQGVGVAPALLGYYGLVVAEQLRTELVATPAFRYQLSATDSASLADLIQLGIPAALISAVGVQAAISVQLVWQLVESLGIGEVVAPEARFNWASTEGVGVASTLSLFLGASTIESVAIEPLLANTAQFRAASTETVGMEQVTAARWVLRVICTDEIDLTPLQALQMLYSPDLVDGVEISAAYVTPDGNITTWAMNTRSAAVTEYSNFEFNSFAAIGRRYVGASETGLYLLDGDTDAGDDIIARIKSGFMQFGGTHLSRLKEAYLGIRGEGDFVLRIVTGQGETYNYAVSTRDMRSTKVHMGKGQRARYFSFELISTGQDFDLDTIEFVPIVVQRRV